MTTAAGPRRHGWLRPCHFVNGIPTEPEHKEGFSVTSTRRDFLKQAVLTGGAVAAAGALSMIGCQPSGGIRGESFKGPEVTPDQDPHQATLRWFREARFGLFITYGLYSLRGIHPFEQYRLRTPVREYEKLKHQFTAKKFDADALTELAIATGMKYVNLVTKHCDGFCLWNTKQTDFNSVRSAARRDLVEEMAEACRKRSLPLFLFYEHGFDWRHPHGPRRKDFSYWLTEVPYDPPEPTYAPPDQHDLQKYVDYVSAHITELLTQYGPVAGIWLDGVAVPASGDKSKFHLEELYRLIYRLQPQALVSYKWGITGKEDFLAPERKQLDKIAASALESGKPMEICRPLQPSWGYAKDEPRQNADWVMEELSQAARFKANLLLNIGPLPEGEVHPDDLVTLRDVGW